MGMTLYSGVMTRMGADGAVKIHERRVSISFGVVVDTLHARALGFDICGVSVVTGRCDGGFP